MKSTRRLVLLLILVVAAGAGAVFLYRNQSTPAPIVANPPVQNIESRGDAPVEEATRDEPETPSLEIVPGELVLAGPGDGYQIVVSRILPDATSEDLTRTSRFEISPDGVAEISPTGYVRALKPGSARLVAHHEGARGSAEVTIHGGELPVSDFALDIVPILTKAGCNSGQCHGAAQGKGGLQLSLFGYDPESDYAALTRGLEGRRIDPFNPRSSLILLKPTLAMPHSGGLRLRPGSREEAQVRRWIEAGTPWHDSSRGRLERLAVEPSDRFLPGAPFEQQIRVTAEYSDGVLRDVTRWCLFVSNDPSTVEVDKHGLAQIFRSGQADIVVRFANKVANVRLTVPFGSASAFKYDAVPARNFIDTHVTRQLEQLRLPMSPRSSDAEFLRRVYFDLIGHMPDFESREDAHFVEDFLADTDPEKREKLIAKLLKHPDFVNFWALKLGDLLQVNSATMGTATGSYRIWLANQIRLDKSGMATSYDTLVKTLLLATGSLRGGQTDAPATYYAAPQEVGEIAEQAARRFLGVRIRCARCHDHPLDVWTQDDYYGFAAFFGGVRVESSGEPFAQEVKATTENSVRHLRTGETPPPKYLGGDVADVTGREDARELLVEWLLDPNNPRFSRMAANWVWAHLMGRGLVEPFDDMRDTNPPSNIELLDDLARHFRDTGYDLRALIRTICESETYQRTSAPVEGNESDEKFFSHALLKPLTAHQMADAIAQVTKVPNSFGMNFGKGTRAIEINDPNIGDYLLDILGRCDRSGGCEVGALARPVSLKLALHLIIGDAINSKLIRQGSLVSEMAEFARQTEPDRRVEVWTRQIESIYLRAYSRYPREEETKFWLNSLAESSDPTEGLEDMVWSILNSREFAVNH